MKNIITNLILAIFLLSCTKENCKEYYENENLKFEYSCDSKKQKNGLFIAYSENGNLIEKSTYENNILNGKSIHFFENGDTSMFLNYKNGLKNGNCRFFILNNVLKFETNKLDDKNVGHFKEYSEKGNLLSYYFYDSTSTLRYRINYEDDSLTERKGQPFLFNKFPKETLCIGDYINFSLNIIEGPFFEDLSISLKLKSNENLTLVDSTILKPDNLILFKKKITKKGIYTLYIDFLYDEEKLKIKKDSISVPVSYLYEQEILVIDCDDKEVK